MPVADADMVISRVMSRYEDDDAHAELMRATGKTPETFAGDSAYVSAQMREAAARRGYEIIYTAGLTPEEVAEKAMGLISRPHTS